jgi:hypothetical protein
MHQHTEEDFISLEDPKDSSECLGECMKRCKLHRPRQRQNSLPNLPTLGAEDESVLAMRWSRIRQQNYPLFSEVPAPSRFKSEKLPRLLTKSHSLSELNLSTVEEHDGSIPTDQIRQFENAEACYNAPKTKRQVHCVWEDLMCPKKVQKTKLETSM